MNRFLSFIEQLRSRPIWQLLVVVASIITFVAIVVGLLADLPAAIDAFQPDHSGENGAQATQPLASASDDHDVSSTPPLIAMPESATSNDPGVNSSPVAQLPTAAPGSSASNENEMLSAQPPTEWLVTPNPDAAEVPSYERIFSRLKGQLYSDYGIEPVVIPSPSDPTSSSLISSHIKIVRGDDSWELEGCPVGSYSPTGRLALICGFGVYLADSTGANRSGPLQPLAIEALSINWSPLWNLDGTAIAYVGCTGNDCAIYQQVIGSEPVQVSAMARRNGWSSLQGYSDDGLSIIYSHAQDPCGVLAALEIESGISRCIPDDRQ